MSGFDTDDRGRVSQKLKAEKPGQFRLSYKLTDAKKHTIEGGYLTMTLTKQPDVAYEVQSAGILLEGQPDSFSPASTTVLLNDATTLKVRDNTLIGTGPARFMRVKVIAVP